MNCKRVFLMCVCSVVLLAGSAFAYKDAFEPESDTAVSYSTYSVEKQEADLNIDTITVDITDEASTEYRIKTGHAITCHNKTKKIELLLEEESLGTQTLFFLAPILKNVFDKGETLCIDEIEMHLHPLLVEFIIGLFHKSAINEKGAQLIFTTQDMHLMSLDLMRRDQLYFVDKNKNTGATEIYSLDEFSVRKNENIRKAYLAGRYGGVPNCRRIQPSVQ